MAETTPTTETAIVEKVARAICYWADPAKNGSCHDNFCVGACSAVQPEQQHYDQARAAIAAMPATQLPANMAELIGKLRNAQDTREAFVRAREVMNAAIPDVVNATPAERALYTERYQADHEAERAHFRAALTLFSEGTALEAIAALEASTQLLQTMAGALERIERCVEYEYGSTGPRSKIARAALAQLRAQEQRS